MAVEWRNNGEPVDGVFIADVDAEDGSQVQTYKGSTYKEVADKLLQAQFHGSRRINELKREVAPDPIRKRPTFQPRELTADEKFQAANDIQDPSKVTDVVDRIVSAKFGAPLEVVRQRLQKQDAEEYERESVAAVNAFVEQTPDWYPTAENKLALWNYLAEHQMELTTKNFRIAFEKSVAAGLVTLKPEAPPAAPETRAPERIVPQASTRPRGSFASGVRSADVGSTAPSGKPRPKYTRQEIDAMPAAVYKSKLTGEAGFAAIVDALG